MSEHSAEKGRGLNPAELRELAKHNLMPGNVVIALLDDNDRLRARTHEAVNECQARFARYVRRCERHDQIARWYLGCLAREGSSEREWTWNSQVMRTLAIAVVEERDVLRATVEEIASLHVRREVGPNAHPTQQNMCQECGDDVPCPTARIVASVLPPGGQSE